MQNIFTIFAFLLAAAATASAQVAPAATAGPAYLRYSLRYAETAEFYNAVSGGNQQTAIASGNLEYANGGERLPFTLTYGGGYNWILSGPPSGYKSFQHMYVTQGFISSRWNMVFYDNVAYVPESATVGFSGVPGTGEPVGGAPSAPDSSASVLTLNSPVVTNDAGGEITRVLTSALKLTAGGSSELISFPDGSGMDTNVQAANVGLTDRLNSRNSLSEQYLFSQYSYGGSPVTFETNTVTVGYNRTWSRRLQTSVSAGPQFSDSSDSAVIPSSLGIFANASATYQFRFGRTGLTYSHGKSSGGGYLLGAEADFIQAHFSREFRRNLTVGVEGAYRRTVGLANTGIIDAKYGGAQTSMRLGRDFMVFANYTAIDQSSSVSLQTNVLNQLEQVVGFGIGYSPRRTHLFRH
jgi:hypothetical protein